MPIPQNAIVWDEPMDPYDVVDYTIDLSPLLTTNESIDTFTAIPGAESQLLGLTVGDGDYAPEISANVLRIWLSIAPGKQTSASFLNTGVSLPIEISVTTNSSPSRKHQRTVVVKVLER